MSTEVTWWCGFSTMTYWTRKDGKGMHVVLTAKGEPRLDHLQAWQDAQQLENRHDIWARENGIRPGTVRIGICPPEYLY